VLRLVDKLRQIEHSGILVLDLSWLNNNLQKALARRARTSTPTGCAGLRPPTATRSWCVFCCRLTATPSTIWSRCRRASSPTPTGVLVGAGRHPARARTSLRTTLAAFKTVGRAVLDNTPTDAHAQRRL
jgi:hypothetical protein